MISTATKLKKDIISPLIFAFVALVPGAGHSQDIGTVSDIDRIFGNAEHQYREMLKDLPDMARYPRTTNADGTLRVVAPWDWTSGFFPGSLWLLYEYTHSTSWLDNAIQRTAGIEGQKYNTGTHDLGFMLGCSFGNGYRMTGNPAYAPILVDAAKSLASRFNANVGCIRSWDFGYWQFPVIIDNMMNLELLFRATELTGDSSYWEKAVSHADITMEHHFRDDFSSFHVVDYNKTTGDTIGKYTHQGISRESAWARGQAWGLYGYTMCYRFTRDKSYLDLAEKIALFMIRHDRFPSDKVPYWDFDAPGIPNEPRDVAAAAIMCAALFELSRLSDTNGITFLNVAIDQINTFATDEYTAPKDSNNHFILMHGTGNYPAGKEIDVPLNYADYYYLQALTRYRRHLNSPPQSGFDWIQRDSITRLEVEFNASGSMDPDNDSLTYFWDFGDDHQELSLTDSTTHVYDNPGTYTVTLIAADKWGGSDTTRHNVIINSFVNISLMEGQIISAYPNPFTDIIRFNFSSLQGMDQAMFSIYDNYGRVVVEEMLDVNQTITWDGRDLNGRQVPPGLYIYILGNESVHAGKIQKIK
jgi:rhamnogalacturonyl hydrolase YesR